MRKTIEARQTVGKQRIKKRFLWWPKSLPRGDGVRKQRRWLEVAEWIQEFAYSPGSPSFDIDEAYWWRDIDWLDNEEQGK